MNRNLMLSAVIIAASATIGATHVQANVLLASDSAANYPSVSSNFNGANFGSGFGAWAVNYSLASSDTNTSNGAGSTIATDRGLSGNVPAFDIVVWPGYGADPGLNGDVITATRPFSSTLAAGQSFTTDLSLGSGATTAANPQPVSPSTADSNMGFSLLDSSGKALFSMTCFGGGEYWASDGTNGGAYFEPSGLGYNYHMDETFVFSLLNTNGNYSVSVFNSTWWGATPHIFTGSINMATGGPSQVQYIDNNGGNYSDVQISSMSIASVPEPATLGLLVMGGLGLLLLKKRRMA